MYKKILVFNIITFLVTVKMFWFIIYSFNLNQGHTWTCTIIHIECIIELVDETKYAFCYILRIINYL